MIIMYNSVILTRHLGFHADIYDLSEGKAWPLPLNIT